MPPVLPTACWLAGATCLPIAAMLPDWRVEVVDCSSQIGSGALPVETLPSAALAFTGEGGDAPLAHPG